MKHILKKEKDNIENVMFFDWIKVLKVYLLELIIHDGGKTDCMWHTTSVKHKIFGVLYPMRWDLS